MSLKFVLNLQTETFLALNWQIFITRIFTKYETLCIAGQNGRKVKTKRKQIEIKLQLVL